MRTTSMALQVRTEAGELALDRTAPYEERPEQPEQQPVGDVSSGDYHESILRPEPDQHSDPGEHKNDQEPRTTSRFRALPAVIADRRNHQDRKHGNQSQ